MLAEAEDTCTSAHRSLRQYRQSLSALLATQNDMFQTVRAHLARHPKKALPFAGRAHKRLETGRRRVLGYGRAALREKTAHAREDRALRAFEARSVRLAGTTRMIELADHDRGVHGFAPRGGLWRKDFGQAIVDELRRARRLGNTLEEPTEAEPTLSGYWGYAWIDRKIEEAERDSRVVTLALRPETGGVGASWRRVGRDLSEGEVLQGG